MTFQIHNSQANKTNMATRDETVENQRHSRGATVNLSRDRILRSELVDSSVPANKQKKRSSDTEGSIVTQILKCGYCFVYITIIKYHHSVRLL